MDRYRDSSRDQNNIVCQWGWMLPAKNMRYVSEPVPPSNVISCRRRLNGGSLGSPRSILSLPAPVFTSVIPFTPPMRIISSPSPVLIFVMPIIYYTDHTSTKHSSNATECNKGKAMVDSRIDQNKSMCCVVTSVCCSDIQ